jgi:hypothetical protein
MLAILDWCRSYINFKFPSGQELAFVLFRQCVLDVNSGGLAARINGDSIGVCSTMGFAFSGTLVCLGVHLVLTRMLAGAKRGAATIDRRYVVMYGKRPKGMALVSLALPLFLGMLSAHLSGADRTAMAVLTLSFAALSAYLLLECFFVRIEFDDSYIYARSVWRSPRVIPWSSVTSCEHSPSCRWWVLSSAEYGNVRVHDFMDGVECLLKEHDAHRVTYMRGA